LRSLEYATRDAELMRDFFQNEGKFEKIFYFSDNSPEIIAFNGSVQSTRPTFTNLRSFLRGFFKAPHLKPGDNFWFFFSGHGIRHQDRDYLMPCDADSDDIECTAISLNFITERLRRCGADNVVLLLDACRNEGDKAGLGVGVEKHQGVITISSCSPAEKSYEIEEIRQGAFTYALLESLRIRGEGNCATVERLYQRLRYRVEAINQYYKKPPQRPYAIVEPASKYHLILLPRQATLQDIAILKMDAYNTEVSREYELAEQLWIRVLGVSPADPDAIKAIRRLSQPSNRQRINPQPPLPIGITRRRLLQFAGVTAGAGVSTVLLAQVFGNEEAPQTPDNIPEDSGSDNAISTTQFEFDVVTVDAKGQETDRRRSQAQYFAEDLGDGVTLEMVAIPDGTFQMGSPESEEGRNDDESPQHQVTVKPFFLGKYPVTQAQWQAVAKLPKVKSDLNPEPSSFKGADRPVERVSWYDAVEFCARLSKQTGREYRLPSEAEWEYACRAGTTTPFHFGETITTDLVNYNGDYTYGDAPKGKDRGETTPVGSFGVANAFGLYDMHGNVWEWCADHWHENYEGAPSDGSAWLGDNDNYSRLLRGGSWNVIPENCRSAFRNHYSPDFRDDTSSGFVLCAPGRGLPSPFPFSSLALYPLFFSLSPPKADRYFFEKWTNYRLSKKPLT
jgi:formylglycine-generating enzyme required for sulfatase activity/uncharacterized caspase-like protein